MLDKFGKCIEDVYDCEIQELGFGFDFESAQQFQY